MRDNIQRILRHGLNSQWFESDTDHGTDSLELYPVVCHVLMWQSILNLHRFCLFEHFWWQVAMLAMFEVFGEGTVVRVNFFCLPIFNLLRIL